MPYTLFLSTFALYLFTLAPSFTVGDAGEFCAASMVLGLPHSPGYPLFCLLGKLFITVIPWGSIAYRVNLVSAVFGAASVSVLFLVTRSLLEPVGRRNLVPAISVLLLAVTPAFWRSAIQTEVFTVNTFFAASILWSFSKRNDLLAVFLFGLGLGNHHTLVFMGPLVAAGIWMRGKPGLKKAVSLALFFFIGFSVYLYLPVRSFKNPGLDWGNPESLHNLWRVISRADYGSLSLTTGEKISRTLPGTIEQSFRFFSILSHQFTLAGVFLGIAGWYWALKKRFAFSKTLLATWLLAGPGFILLANLPFNAESEGILERFYILSNLFWAPAVAWGILWLYERYKAPAKYAAVLVAAVLLLTALRIPEINWRHYYLAYDYGRNLLKTLAPGSVLFMDGGDDTFYSLAYLCFAEKRRPDVELHDRGGLVFKNVYGNDFRKIPKEDKEKRRREVERVYAMQRPVYFSTFNKEVMPGVELAADGILYRPLNNNTMNSLACYSLRSVYGSRYADYRSRALVPVYPYFYAFYDSGNLLSFWQYAYNKWPEALWLKTNMRVELLHEAFTEFSANNLDRAAMLYEQLSRWYPEEVSAFVNLGVIEEKRGSRQKAKEYYMSAIQVNPAYTDSYYNIAVLYWQENNWQEVVRYLQKILSINPNDQRALHFLPIAEKNRQRSGGTAQ